MVSRDNKRIPFDYDTDGSITLPNSILHMPWFICDRSRDLDVDWLAALETQQYWPINFCALVAGVGGGLSGVWGPPTVVYLSKDSLKKEAQVCAQGVIYGLCSIFLFLGHVQSGIATAPVLALGLCAIIPAFFGQWIGFKIQDSINQVLFSKITLCILLVAALNLIRRGLL